MGKSKRSGNTGQGTGCCVNCDLSKIKFSRLAAQGYNFEKRAN